MKKISKEIFKKRVPIWRFKATIRNIVLIMFFSLVSLNSYSSRIGDDQAVPEKSVAELRENYGNAKTTWDASTGKLTFTASGSINFNYGFPLDYKWWIWRVPVSVKVIHINSGVTVNGGFHTYGDITIRGEGRDVSFIYGTNQRKWADDPEQDGSVDLDEWYYSTIESHSGNLKVQDLEMKNPYSYHISGSWNDKTEVYRCDLIDDRGGFENHSDGVFAGPGSLVEDCYFSTSDDNIKFYQSSFTVRNSTFVMIDNAIPFQFGWNPTPNGDYKIENCTVTGTSGSGPGNNNMPVFSWRGGNSSKTVTVTGLYVDNPNASIFEIIPSDANLNVLISDSYISTARFYYIFGGTGSKTICGLDVNNTSNQFGYYDCRTDYNSIQIDGPNVVSPGNTIELQVDYTVSGDKDIRVQIAQRDPWVPYGQATMANVSSGSGTFIIDLPIDLDTPIADDAYQYYAWITNPGDSWENRNANAEEIGISCEKDVVLSNGNESTLERPFLSPNPVSSFLFAKIPPTLKGSLNISIIDITGKVVYKHLNQIQNSTNKLQLDCSHLNEGVYFLNVQSDSGACLKKKFLKISE